MEGRLFENVIPFIRQLISIYNAQDNVTDHASKAVKQSEKLPVKFLKCLCLIAHVMGRTGAEVHSETLLLH